MEPQTARLDRSGRLVLPASIRSQLELREGDEVVFAPAESPGEVRLLPRRLAVRQAQALIREAVPAHRRLVDELLAQRRGEAQREVQGALPRRPRKAS